MCILLNMRLCFNIVHTTYVLIKLVQSEWHMTVCVYVCVCVCVCVCVRVCVSSDSLFQFPTYDRALRLHLNEFEVF